MRWLISPQCRIYTSENRINIGSDNGLSPIRRQAIIWTNAGLLSIGPLGTNFSEVLIKIQNWMHLKMSSAKWRPFCPVGGWVNGITRIHVTHMHWSTSNVHWLEWSLPSEPQTGLYTFEQAIAHSASVPLVARFEQNESSLSSSAPSALKNHIYVYCDNCEKLLDVWSWLQRCSLFSDAYDIYISHQYLTEVEILMCLKGLRDKFHVFQFMLSLVLSRTRYSLWQSKRDWF